MFNHKRYLLTLLSILSISFLTGCGDDDDSTPNLNVPETYAFTRNGESTVSFSGQTTRIGMAEEIVSALSDNTMTEAEIDAMFAHAEGDDDFSDASLNASGKNVRSKTAASTDFFSANATESAEIKEEFDGWIQAQVDEVFPEWSNDASDGNAGQIQEAGGGSVRYVNANGLEYNQAFGKSLIGALMTDQALNNYLGSAVLDAGTNVEDNDNGVLDGSNNYTTMEHKWDEAYGYLYGTAANTADPNATIGEDDSFLNKYIGRVEGDSDFAGIADDIFNAFKLGRAAIVAGDYETRDEQASIIREKVSEIIAIRAVYYLQTGKNGLEAASPDMAAIFHDLSEAYGFIYSLQFTRDPMTDAPYFSRSEVQGFLDKIYPTSGDNNGFWDVTTNDLQDVSEDIAAGFDFTIDQAAN